MAQLILWGPTAGNGDVSPAIRNSAIQNLAAWLRQHGYSVKVIDFCHLMSVDDLVKISQKYITEETVAIGVSSTFWGVQSLGDLEPPPPPGFMKQDRS